MSRIIERRIDALERARPFGHQLTRESLLETARSLRAGGDMPREWSAVFTPSQILRMAEIETAG